VPFVVDGRKVLDEFAQIVDGHQGSAPALSRSKFTRPDGFVKRGTTNARDCAGFSNCVGKGFIHGVSRWHCRLCSGVLIRTVADTPALSAPAEYEKRLFSISVEKSAMKIIEYAYCDEYEEVCNTPEVFPPKMAGASLHTHAARFGALPRDIGLRCSESLGPISSLFV
jgi:hypothetical protein